MGRRYWYPCKICRQLIHVGKIKEEDIMWESEDDGIAHTKCLGESYNVDEWITTDEMRDSADMSEFIKS